MHYAETLQRVSLLSQITTLDSVSAITRKLRWSLRPPMAMQCVLLTRPQAGGGGGVLLTGTVTN